MRIKNELRESLYENVNILYKEDNIYVMDNLYCMTLVRYQTSRICNPSKLI